MSARHRQGDMATRELGRAAGRARLRAAPALCLLLALAGQAAAAWLDSVQISENVDTAAEWFEGCLQNQVVMDGEGNLHLFYMNAFYEQAFYRYWDGKEWSIAFSVSGDMGSAPYDCSLWLHPSGELHFFWDSNFVTYRRIKRTDGSWSRIDPVMRQISDTQSFMDSRGRVFISGDSTAVDYRLPRIVLIDGEEIQELAPLVDGQDCKDPVTFFEDIEGTIWAMGRIWNPEERNIHWAATPYDEAGGWDESRRIFLVRFGLYRPHVLCDSQGIWHVVFQRGYEEMMPTAVRYYYYDGERWSDGERIDVLPDYFSSVRPRMYIDRNDVVHVVFRDEGGRGWLRGYVWYRKRENGVWSTPIPFSDVNYAGNPQIIGDESGELHAIFHTGPAPPRLFHRRYIPGDPSVELRLNGERFGPGDALILDAWLHNPHAPFTVDLYCLLEVAGEYYFYPSWSEEVDFQRRELPDSGTALVRLLQVRLPEDLRPLGTLHFHAGLLYPESDYLLAVDSLEFQVG